MTWTLTAAQVRELDSEMTRLLGFARASRLERGGFGWLGEDGAADAARPAERWITCRMTHVFALGLLRGGPAADGLAALVDHGVRALETTFADDVHGGWFAVAPSAGEGLPASTSKDAYPHAFVVLAAASATAAGRPGAEALLDRALTTHAAHFWDEAEGMVVESWDRTFTTAEAYRGVNAVMHTVEAYLAAADVTGADVWLDRAVRMIERVVDGMARRHGWRIPEHFDAAWRPLLDYNADAPAHPFRPYGATIGHWFEWARLTVHARAELAARGRSVPEWMLDGAVALFDAAVREGWGVDGQPGFVYTVDWDGRPVVRERMHWVLCEALAAAAALGEATGEDGYREAHAAWWAYAVERVLDVAGGSWWHELGPDGAVSRTVWSGKPDVYHAVQATLVPRLPLAPALAPALARGLLR